MVRNGSKAVLPVTVVVMTKNEERNISDCLACLDDFKEVLVVDSCSQDRTKELASKFGVEVLEFNWNGKFPKKRNWVLQNYNFKTEWVLFLDADERITNSFVNELSIKLNLSNFDGYWLNYRNFIGDRPLNHGSGLRKLALFKPEKGSYEKTEEVQWTNYDCEVHEYVQIKGRVSEINAKIDHLWFVDFNSFLAKHDEYAKWEANKYLSNSKEENLHLRQKIKNSLISSYFFAPAFFIYSYFFKMGFLDGAHGFKFASLKYLYYRKIYNLIKTGNLA